MAHVLPSMTPLEHLQVKNRIMLPVKERRDDMGKPCFIVTYQDENYPINLFDCQKSEALPAEIQCIVKGFQSNGRPIFSQDYTPLLKRFYDSGKEYEFTVTADFSHLPEGQAYYSIRDKYGFSFSLHHFDRTRLAVRQIVRCSVRFHGARLVPTLVQDRNTRTTRILDPEVVKAKVYSEATDLSLWDLNSLVDLVFSKENEGDFNNRMVVWLRHELTKFADYNAEERLKLLQELERCCLYLVENSDLFRDCDTNERHSFLHRLSSITEVVESYRKAQQYIEKDLHLIFVDNLLQKLNTAGYLYHAEEHLRTLSSLFALMPELMPRNMARLFDIMRKGNTRNWYTEPIRTAFLVLLELYINTYRDCIDTLIMPDADNPDGIIAKVIQALAMQMLLSTPEDAERDSHIFDRHLNQALFYRALTYKPLANTDILLEKSYQSLLGFFRETSTIYTWQEVHEMAQLATRAASQMPNTSDTEQQLNQTLTRYLDGSNARLELTLQGINLYPQRRGNTCAPALPKDLLKWHQPQVHTNKSVSHSRLRTDDLLTYRQMWSDIEGAMEQVQLVAAERPTKATKVPPQKGDTVTIRIVDEFKRDGKTHTFLAEIVDDHFCGEGLISIGNIVDYNAHATVYCFTDISTGEPLLFETRVDNYEPENERFIFSMRAPLFEYLYENVLSYDEEYHCFVTAQTPYGFVVISEQGYSFNVTATPDMPALAPGDQIIVRLNEKNPYNNSTAYFIREANPIEMGVTAAFHALMDSYACDVYVPEQGETLHDDADDQATDIPLPISYVQELTQLLDRVAVLRGDYTQSYNYLAMARLLAKFIGDTNREAYYNERMRLLELLKRFAIDGTINTEELQAFATNSETLVASYPELQKQFLRLQVVSFMGKSERNAEVWSTLNGDTTDTLLLSLARLVLTYNILHDTGMEIEKKAVHDRIYEELRIDARKSDLHYYGDEGLRLEFKTTIVCPPDNNMRPDLPRQTFNIMRAIAGLLNAEGGTLLLGVNDQGMAVGLQNDLNYPQFANSRERYKVYVENQINTHLGANAGRQVRMVWEIPNNRPVLRLDIKPSPTLVELDGKVYERRGTSTRPLTGDDLRQYRQQREQQVQTLSSTGHTALADQLTQFHPVTEVEEAPVSSSPAVTPSTAPTAKPRPQAGSVATSQLRNNDIYDLGTDDTFEEAIAVLNFYDADSTYKLTEGYADDTASVSLAIRESDRGHFLLLCYANDHCVRMNLDEILSRKANAIYTYYSESPLRYVSVIRSGESFMSIRRDDKGRLFLRIDPADQVPVTSSIGKAMPQYLDLRGYEYVASEVLPARLSSHFAAYRRQVPTSLGIPISNKKNVAQEFEQHGIKVEV